MVKAKICKLVVVCGLIRSMQNTQNNIDIFIYNIYIVIYNIEMLLNHKAKSALNCNINGIKNYQ